MKKIKITFDKIPSVFKNVPLEKTVSLVDKVVPQEGSIIAVKAESHEGKMNIIDFPNGRLGQLWQHDIFPAVLGYRKASVEFAGYVPEKVLVGDNLYLLCESGLVGLISGVFESWGKPMKVKVLGSVLAANGSLMNLKQFKIKPKKRPIKNNIPLIVFIGTRMDSGKTTMACKIGNALRAKGKKVAGVKLTGVAFTQDLYKMREAGISPCFDFVDMGLPSTCNGNKVEVIDSALNLVEIAKQSNPFCILVEFGDGVLGEYHVADILNNEMFKSQVKFVVLAANDFSGIYGTKKILSDYGIQINMITGPVADSQVGIDLIEKYFHLPSESNQYQTPKTIDILKKLL